MAVQHIGGPDVVVGQPVLVQHTHSLHQVLHQTHKLTLPPRLPPPPSTLYYDGEVGVCGFHEDELGEVGDEFVGGFDGVGGGDGVEVGALEEGYFLGSVDFVGDFVGAVGGEGVELADGQGGSGCGLGDLVEALVHVDFVQEDILDFDVPQFFEEFPAEVAEDGEAEFYILSFVCVEPDVSGFLAPLLHFPVLPHHEVVRRVQVDRLHVRSYLRDRHVQRLQHLLLIFRGTVPHSDVCYE